MFAASLLVIVIAVPLVTAFIGYITNWAAVKMIFHPQEFIGVWKIGWQGVVYSKGEKFARDAAATVNDVISTDELTQRLDPDDLERLFGDRIDAELPTIVAAALDAVAPGVWEQMAPVAQTTVIDQLKGEMRQAAADSVESMGEMVSGSLDLETLVYQLLSGENSSRLGRLFQEIGAKELVAIVRFGGVFGFIIGCFQALSYSLFDQWWLLPIVGGIVGLGTNYLAIQMIFRPQEPTKYFGLVTYQGMFPARQHQIAADYGMITQREILTAANLIDIIGRGSAGAQVLAMARATMAERLEATRPMLSMMAQRELTDDDLASVRAVIESRLAALWPEIRPELEAALDERLAVGSIVEKNLSSMPKATFEQILRGVFEQDEWILIAIGGFLGAAVGLLQAALVLAIG